MQKKLSKKLGIIIMGLVIATTGFTAVSYASTQPTPVDPDPSLQPNIIKNINEFLKSHNTLISRFSQVNNFSDAQQGWFAIDKANNRARIEYKNQPIRIIINNSSIMYEQITLKEKTFTPLINSPLKYIISSGATLNSQELNIKSITTLDDNYLVTVTPVDNPSLGTIIFAFSKKSFTLTGWTILDNMGSKTMVTLLNPSFSNKKIPSPVFNTHRTTVVNFNDLRK